MNRAHIIFTLGVLIGSANADTIYNNIGSGDSGFLAVGNVLSESDWANEFETVGGAGLGGIFLVLSQSGRSDTVSALLYSDNAGVPNALIATICTITPPQGGPEIDFCPGSSLIILQASTQYWIVLVDNNTGSFAEWQSAADDSGTGVSTESHAFWNGAAWVNEPNSTFTTTIPEMQIGVGAPAEPATFGLLSAALAGLVLFGRRRRLSACDAGLAQS